jgi:predicted DNA-binding transcriptional regulator AlpA
MNTCHRDISKLPAEAVLRLPDVLALVGLSRASVYAKVANHRFPAPIKLTAHASGWRLGDVRTWLEDPTGWVEPEQIEVR